MENSGESVGWSKLNVLNNNKTQCGPGLMLHWHDAAWKRKEMEFDTKTRNKTIRRGAPLCPNHLDPFRDHSSSEILSVQDCEAHKIIQSCQERSRNRSQLLEPYHWAIHTSQIGKFPQGIYTDKWLLCDVKEKEHPPMKKWFGARTKLM